MQYFFDKWVDKKPEENFLLANQYPLEEIIIDYGYESESLSNNSLKEVVVIKEEFDTDDNPYFSEKINRVTILHEKYLEYIEMLKEAEKTILPSQENRQNIQESHVILSAFNGIAAFTLPFAMYIILNNMDNLLFSKIIFRENKLHVLSEGLKNAFDLLWKNSSVRTMWANYIDFTTYKSDSGYNIRSCLDFISWQDYAIAISEEISNFKISVHSGISDRLLSFRTSQQISNLCNYFNKHPRNYTAFYNLENCETYKNTMCEVFNANSGLGESLSRTLLKTSLIEDSIKAYSHYVARNIYWGILILTGFVSLGGLVYLAISGYNSFKEYKEDMAESDDISSCMKDIKKITTLINFCELQKIKLTNRPLQTVIEDFEIKKSDLLNRRECRISFFKVLTAKDYTIPLEISLKILEEAELTEPFEAGYAFT